MGCASSKRLDAAAVPYRPAPSSFAVFDINGIEEPWLKHINSNNNTELEEKADSESDPILHKLNSMLDATEGPQSWDEVSKTLEDLKPVIIAKVSEPKPPQKTKSFHTLEDLEEKGKGGENERERVRGNKLKDNIFIVKDRLERKKEEKESSLERLRRDPLSEFPEKCPPGGSETVVIYTTSLGGVRKTFEDCNRARDLLEGHRVVFDERDVSLHGEFLREVKEMEVEMTLPRVFVKGKYVGGLEELVELNETGRLGRILNATRLERGIGRQVCGGCGGSRFIPCFHCGGSCKILIDHNSLHKQRCPKCNENGLVHCPTCISI